MNLTPGDYIKAEFRDGQSGESEWMWLCIDSCDDVGQIAFGRLDSVPILDYQRKVKIGSQLAVSYKNIREHKKAAEFKKR